MGIIRGKGHNFVKKNQIKNPNTHLHIMERKPAAFQTNPTEDVEWVADTRFMMHGTHGHTGRCLHKSNSIIPLLHKFCDTQRNINVLGDCLWSPYSKMTAVVISYCLAYLSEKASLFREWHGPTGGIPSGVWFNISTGGARTPSMVILFVINNWRRRGKLFYKIKAVLNGMTYCIIWYLNIKSPT